MKSPFAFFVFLMFALTGRNEVLNAQDKSILPGSISERSGSKCAPEFLETSFGECIGRYGSFYPFDVDKDGIPEIITTAAVTLQSGIGIWYILKYNATTAKYEQSYFKQYPQGIIYINIIDIKDDGSPELVVVQSDRVHYIDLTTLKNIQTVHYNINFFSYVMDLKYEDANSDGQKELVLSAANKLYLIDPEDFTIYKSYPIIGGKFQVGNVDDDARSEIVFRNGEVIEINPITLALKMEPNFLSGDQSSTRFFLEDVDNDGKMEAILHSSPISDIGIYDIEKKKLKSTFTGNMDDLILYDVDQDGDKDAISTYSPLGTLEDFIICVDILTNTELWRLESPHFKNEAIAVGDFDNDGLLEIAWTSRCDDLLNDQMYVYDIQTGTEEWKNEPLNNRYYANTTADLDGDNMMDYIVVRSRGVNDFINTINVYDAETRLLKYKSDPSLLEGVSGKITNIEIYDYAQDGDNDIIIALVDNNIGGILILDGFSFEIEQRKNFTHDEQFIASAIGDVDNDMLEELILSDRNNIYIFSLIDLELIKLIPINFDNSPDQELLIGNIDSNTGNEVIICASAIYKLSNTNFEIAKAGTYEYTSAHLFDWNKDGIMDVVTGTDKGQLKIFDGDLNLIYENQIGKNLILNGIRSGDIDGDGEDELVIAIDDEILFLDREGNYTSRNELGYGLGQYASLHVSDTDNDGKAEVMVGNNNSVFILNDACNSCLSYDPMVQIIDPKCNLVLGSIIPDPGDNSTVFIYQDTILKDTLRNLDVGSYLITAVNENYCFKNFYIDLVQRDLKFKHEIESRDCAVDKLSDVSVKFINGQAPYEYAWSNGSITDTLFDLPSGVYSVTITDSNGCINNETFEINDQTMKAFVYNPTGSCIDKNNGNTSIYTTQGRSPFTYKWDDGTELHSNFKLSGGAHSAMIKDANGCADTLYFQVPTKIVRLDAILQSNNCSGKNNGAAKVNVLEGEEPYDYKWSTGKNSFQIINATGGIYTVTVTDNHDCTAIDTVIINSSDISVTPVITDNICFGDSKGAIDLIINEGIKPFKYVWSGTHNTTGNVSDLQSGEYSVHVIDSVNCGIFFELNISSPEEIIIDVVLTPDDLGTSASDGKIEAIVSGGIPPYSFDWGNGQSESILDSLPLGTYNVTVTDANECQSAKTIVLNTSSTTLSMEAAIKLFPNPANTYVKITSETGAGFSELKITDIICSNYFKYSINKSGNSYELDINDLPSGTYLVSGKWGDLPFCKILAVVK